ncbi:HNH endonuclease signature motif containing protein [Pseudonocardia endophytica]|nr:HNH endonuclease signature motif containing protein [Pseudonocardia endophytica]
MREWWRAEDEELLVALGDAQRVLNETFAAMLPVLADLVHDVQNVSRGAARARVRAAEDLEPVRTPTGELCEAALPVLAAAVQEAAVSAEHVRVIQAVLASVPPHLEDHRPALEADLALHARTLDPDAVAKLGRKAIALLDPDGPRPRDPRPARNRLTLRPLGDGFEAKGWFDTESAAVLRTALSPLTAPGGVTGPHGRGCTCTEPAADPDAGADLAHESGASGPADPVVCPTVLDRDPRSRAERDGDGLVELAPRVIAAGDLGADGGQAVQVVVTVPLETLESRAGGALIGFGDGTLAEAISAETARRLACDARVVPIVLGAAGEPVDVGREARLATRAQRRALAQRDGGCAFPGCDCPPQWCSAHHVVHWVDDGPTDLSNLVLLCSRHHTVIHHAGWTITMEDGFPLFRPPPWIPGGPRRNPVHRPDLVGRIPEARPPARIVDLTCLASAGQ